MKVKNENSCLRMLPVVLGIAVTLVFGGGCGNKYEKALTLFEQEKWQEALAVVEETPKEDTRVQLYIGRAYANGLGGLEKSCKTAIMWYEKSAAQDCIDGLLACAEFYESGQ